MSDERAEGPASPGDGEAGVPETLSPGQALELDRACYCFEAELRGGRRPRLEDFLAGRDEPLRSALRRELQANDQKWACRAGESAATDLRTLPGPGRDGLGLPSTRRQCRARAGRRRTRTPPNRTRSIPMRPGSRSQARLPRRATGTLPIVDRDGAARWPGTGASSGAWPTVPGYEILGSWAGAAWASSTRPGSAGLNRLVALKMIRGGSHARPEQLRPVPDRGRGGRPAPPPQHRPDLRDRRGRRPALLLAGAARGGQPRRPARRHAPAGPRRRPS